MAIISQHSARKMHTIPAQIPRILVTSRFMPVWLIPCARGWRICIHIEFTFIDQEHASRMCIRICYKVNSCKKREVRASNSKSMVLTPPGQITTWITPWAYSYVIAKATLHTIYVVAATKKYPLGQPPSLHTKTWLSKCNFLTWVDYMRLVQRTEN